MFTNRDAFVVVTKASIVMTVMVALLSSLILLSLPIPIDAGVAFEDDPYLQEFLSGKVVVLLWIPPPQCLTLLVSESCSSKEGIHDLWTRNQFWRIDLEDNVDFTIPWHRVIRRKMVSFFGLDTLLHRWTTL